MTTLRFIERRPSLLLVIGIVLVSACVVVVVGPAAAQKSKKAPAMLVTQNTFKEVLAQYQGQTTNLGVLKKVSGDHIVVEEEGATALYPLSAIQAFRILKPEEDVSILLEIRLVSKE